MARRHLFKIGRRAALAFTLALAAALLFGRQYVQLWLPLYQQVIAWLLPEYRVVEVVLQSQPSAPVVKLSVELVHQTLVGLKLLPQGLSVSSTTLQGHALQHPILIATVLFASPLGENASWTQRFGSLGVGLIGLMLVEALDIPFVLAGSVTDLLLADFAPHLQDQSGLVQWMYILNGGGRLALSVGAALVAVAGCRYLFSRRSGLSRT